VGWGMWGWRGGADFRHLQPLRGTPGQKVKGLSKRSCTDNESGVCTCGSPPSKASKQSISSDSDVIFWTEQFTGGSGFPGKIRKGEKCKNGLLEHFTLENVRGPVDPSIITSTPSLNFPVLYFFFFLSLIRNLIRGRRKGKW
jgi:hypothetical protein